MRFNLLLSLVIFGSFQWAFAQTTHSGVDQGRNRPIESNLSSVISFSVQAEEEFLANPENPSKAIHKEWGEILDVSGKKQKAIRVYRGQKGRSLGDLDLFAVQVGRARTYQAAKRACDKLIPLGQWKLATVAHVMAFFLEVAPSFPLPQQPNKKGFLFWASSANPSENKENKEAFFSTWEGSDSRLETLLFSDYLRNLQNTIKRAQSKEEKEYYIDLLKRTREGIPALCVFGNEP